MIFIDERKIQTLMVATGASKETILERLKQVIAEKGDKKALCSLWYDEGGILCTYCGEGMFDGVGPHACEEVNNEDEYERVEFYEMLHQELLEKLPESPTPPEKIDLKLYMKVENQVTEPDGLVDMINDGSLKRCWYKEHWDCCDLCAKVYFQNKGEEGKRDQICLTESKEDLQSLKAELEKWLTG